MIHLKEDFPPGLWFDRAALALKLPRWIGICTIGAVPAAVLWYWGIETRIATDFTGVPIVSLPLLLTNVVFLLGATHLIRARILELRDYTVSLGAKPAPNQVGLLSGWKGLGAVWAVLIAATWVVFDPYVFNLYYPPYQELQRIFVTSYLRFIQATFLWVLGCAMYLIYKWGKLPIKLKSFTEDKMLGLNTYGRASLLFVSLYVVAMLLTFPVFVYKGEAVIVSQAIFSLVGLALFLAPLLSLRRKLVRTKMEKLAWIQKRHSRVMNMIEAAGDGPLDATLVNELAAVDSIKSELQRIRSWPFDTGIAARLLSVVALPLVVYVLATFLARTLSL